MEILHSMIYYPFFLNNLFNSIVRFMYESANDQTDIWEPNLSYGSFFINRNKYELLTINCVLQHFHLHVCLSHSDLLGWRTAVSMQVDNTHPHNTHTWYVMLCYRDAPMRLYVRDCSSSLYHKPIHNDSIINVYIG